MPSFLQLFITLEKRKERKKRGKICDLQKQKQLKMSIQTGHFLAWVKSPCSLACLDSFWPGYVAPTNCLNAFVSSPHPTQLDISPQQPSTTSHQVHSHMNFLKDRASLIFPPYAARLRGVKSAAAFKWLTGTSEFSAVQPGPLPDFTYCLTFWIVLISHRWNTTMQWQKRFIEHSPRLGPDSIPEVWMRRWVTPWTR